MSPWLVLDRGRIIPSSMHCSAVPPSWPQRVLLLFSGNGGFFNYMHCWLKRWHKSRKRSKASSFSFPWGCLEPGRNGRSPSECIPLRWGGPEWEAQPLPTFTQGTTLTEQESSSKTSEGSSSREGGRWRVFSFSLLIVVFWLFCVTWQSQKDLVPNRREHRS